MSGTPKWTSVAFPSEIVEAVRELIKELKYWPSVSTFCREAVLEKIDKERRKLKELRAERRPADSRLLHQVAQERKLLKELKDERQEPSVNEDSMKGRKRQK